MYEVLEIRKGGGILAAWPVVYWKKDEAKHICMPSLTQKLGILFAPTDAKRVEVQSANQRLASELMEKLGHPADFNQNFHENFTDWLPFFWKGYTQTTRYTYVLEDIADPATLWKDMRPHHRRVIRKAEKLGVRIADDLELPQFIELNRKTFSRQGLTPVTGEDTIRRLDAACCANAGRKILGGVDSQGRIHAAVYIAWANDTAYCLMGGASRNCGRAARICWRYGKPSNSPAR